MIDVRLIQPGSDFDDLPEPADENAYAFDPETRKAFLRQAESLAWGTDRRLFVATERGLLVSAGLTRICQVISRQGAEVKLSGSHALHPVSPRVPLKVGDWYELAIASGSGVILAVIEVATPIPPEPTSTYSIDLSTLPSVSGEDAKAFFSKVRRQPHIPFQYPENGCFARAQEMSRLIEQFFDPNTADVVVAKIWNFGRFRVNSENHPHCQARWHYHVAPVVKTDAGLLVIDPSLFDQPVDIAGWRHKQVNSVIPPEDPLFTTLEAYEYAGNSTGERLFFGSSLKKTQEHLRLFLGELFLSIYDNGPLPYRCGS